jgi:hypothetical protein
VHTRVTQSKEQMQMQTIKQNADQQVRDILDLNRPTPNFAYIRADAPNFVKAVFEAAEVSASSFASPLLRRTS